MEYIMYVDGGHSQELNKVAAGFMIQTAEKYIGMGASTGDGGDVSVAEALAIGIAVNYLLRMVDLVKGVDIVDIRSDSSNIIAFFQKIKSNETKPTNVDYRILLAWDKLVELDKVCDWKLTKVSAHKNEINGNKLVDRLVKYALQIHKDSKKEN